MWRNQQVAENMGAEFYIFRCLIHGDTAHKTDDGRCVKCFPTTHHVGGICEKHGPTVFYRHLRACRGCVAGSGRPRVPTRLYGSPLKRQEAARAGAATFTNQCLLHGFVPFSVKTGLCTVCFDTHGKARSYTLAGPSLHTAH